MQSGGDFLAGFLLKVDLTVTTLNPTQNPWVTWYFSRAPKCNPLSIMKVSRPRDIPQKRWASRIIILFFPPWELASRAFLHIFRACPYSSIQLFRKESSSQISFFYISVAARWSVIMWAWRAPSSPWPPRHPRQARPPQHSEQPIRAFKPRPYRRWACLKSNLRTRDLWKCCSANPWSCQKRSRENFNNCQR